MTTTYDEITDRFEKYLQEVGYGKGSRHMLPLCVGSFLRHSRPADLDEVSADDIMSFYEWLQVRPHQRREGGLSEVYVHHHIYALKVFFTWLQQSGAIEVHPMNTLSFPRPKYERRRPLQRTEIEELFSVCETPEETALLHLFYSCGLRRSEAVALDTGDVHPGSGFLYVRHGKGAKRRAVPLTERVARELRLYMEEERKQIITKDTEAFMVSTIGTRMSGDAHTRRLKKLLARTGIERDIGLHHLRHSIATHLLESGLSLEYVRDFLGHRHLEATQIYTTINKWNWKNT